MAHQVDLFLVDARSEIQGRFVAILDELLEGHAALIEIAPVRLSRTALVPVNHDEVFLQLSIEVTGHQHLRRPRPAMQPEQDRV